MLRRASSAIALVFVLAFATTGCRGAGGPLAFAGGVVIGAAIADHDYFHGHRDADVPTIVYVNAPPAIATPASPRDKVEVDDRVRFDGIAARSAFASIDVSSCGGPRGYGHARVSFNPTGEATKVVVDEPGGLSPEVAACIGERLGTATVPPFSGSLVTVGTTYLVR